jgi:hypothetical protein
VPPSDKGVAYVVAHIALLPEGHPLKLLYADMYTIQFADADPVKGTRDYRASEYKQRVDSGDGESPPHPTDIHCYDFFALDSRVRGQFAEQTRVWLTSRAASMRSSSPPS